MMKIGDRVREIKTRLAGKVIAIEDCGVQGNLYVIRLDKEDPLWGKLITAWPGELEVLDVQAIKEVSE